MVFFRLNQVAVRLRCPRRQLHFRATKLITLAKLTPVRDSFPLRLHPDRPLSCRPELVSDGLGSGTRLNDGGRVAGFIPASRFDPCYALDHI